MQDQVSLGAALTVIVGGLLHGSFALPMKKIKNWKWENIWLVYSVVGLICCPIALALATVPGLWQAFENTAGGTLALIALCGFGWGLGSTLFGLGIARVGIGLAFAIILGITSSVGSLLPIMVNNPAYLGTNRGLAFLGGLAVALVGIVLCAMAGSEREKRQNPQVGGGHGAGFGTGLLICLASGLLSPALNFGFAFGKPLQDAAQALGAKPDLAGNAIWVLGLLGGLIPNAGYALYLLTKNKTWSQYTAPGSAAWYWLGAAVMGVLWYGGVSIYGMGASQMGAQMGAVLGWPIFMSVVIVIGNVWGALTGEWSGAGAKAIRLGWLGNIVLLVAITVIAQVK
jgi:L-rhamnose-H+ transport protein